MPRWRTTLLAPVLLALISLQLLSGCILVPVDDGRGRGGGGDGRGYERGHDHDRHDDYRR
jgi:hypothetical protein